MEKKDIRFTSLLFNKLKQLQKDDRIFEEGEKNAKKFKDLKSLEDAGFTLIADRIINILLKKTGFEFGSLLNPAEEVEKFIDVAEEFLAIFEEKGETVAVPVKEIKEVLSIVEQTDSTDNDDIQEILKKYVP